MSNAISSEFNDDTNFDFDLCVIIYFIFVDRLYIFKEIKIEKP